MYIEFKREGYYLPYLIKITLEQALIVAVLAAPYVLAALVIWALW